MWVQQGARERQRICGNYFYHIEATAVDDPTKHLIDTDLPEE
jgi:hypothetical protein